MSRSGCFVAGVVAALFIGKTAMGQSSPPAAPAGVAASQARDLLEVACRHGDWVGVERVLTDAWRVDRAWALDRARELIIAPGARGAALRPIGAGLIADNGSADEIAQTVSRLDAGRDHDERRLLVRRLGTAMPRNTAKDAALRYLSDRDLFVRGAAAQALGEIGDVDALDALLPLMPSQSLLEQKTPGDGEQTLLQNAVLGAVEALSATRALRDSDARNWWKAAKALPKPAGKVGVFAARLAEASQKPVTGTWSGSPYTQSPSFNIFYKIGRQNSAPGDGDLSWAKAMPALEMARQVSIENAAAVFGGRACMPVVRLFIADEQQFLALGGQPSFAGLAHMNEVLLRANPLPQLSTTLVHEYVHVIHNGTFRNQPRWLSEGLAESLTYSAKASRWSAAMVRQVGLDEDVQRGAVSEILQWRAGGTTDVREGLRYRQSHLVVDYLRFGPFAAAETRLLFFMGRVSRQEAPQRALEELYGMDLRGLDAGMREWLATQKQVPPGG